MVRMKKKLLLNSFRTIQVSLHMKSLIVNSIGSCSNLMMLLYVIREGRLPLA